MGKCPALGMNVKIDITEHPVLIPLLVDDPLREQDKIITKSLKES